MKSSLLLLSAITTVLMAAAGGQRATAQTLQVHHADGTTTDHVLGTGTKLLFQDDRVLLASPSQTLDFAKSDVLAFTYHYSKYDLNGDNVIDKKDLTSVVETISGLHGKSRREADVNGDGVANIGDIIDVINVMANGEKSVATYTPTLGSGTIGDAFFIYCNDGLFNAFFREEIDSIGFSHYDADSLRYNKIASQVVYTPDSTYMIPLVAIDSVGFVTPKTEYKPGVIPLIGNIRDYVVSSDSMTVFFRQDTPLAILPRIGDKLVTEEISDVFRSGFIGQVESIETVDGKIAFHCSKVDFEDVFEYYYFVTQGDVNASSRRASDGGQLIENTWERTYSPGTMNFPLTNYITPYIYPDPAGDLAFQIENRQNISFTPTFKVKFVRIVSPKLGTVVSLDITEDDVIKEDVNISGVLNWSHDFDAVDIPLVELGIPFLWLYARAGGFVSAEASVSMEQHWSQSYRYTFHLEAGSRSFYVPHASINGIQLTNDHGGQAMVKGEASLGIFAELGVEFADRNIASVAYRGEVGVSISGGVMLYKKDIENALHSTDLYKTLQGDEIKLKGFFKTGLPVKLLWFGWPNEHKKKEKEFARVSLVPNFSDTKLERDKDEKSTLFAQTKVSGACFPVDLGFTLFEKESTEGKTSYARSGYMGPSTELYSSFFNMSTSEKYEVYPTVKLMGIEMLAEPKGEEKGETSCPDENHPHAIDLGLPSGTKWACCNVGASTPEGYGNYYAWGETSPKSVYNWATYKYGYYNYDGDYSHLVNIGSDIAGTGYDAVTANWGSPWRMPSWSQIKELVNNTTSTWTTQNGVSGRKFTGSNGGTVFLPAAGYRWNDELNDAGSYGYYWSSSLYESLPYLAYSLFFHSGLADWYRYNRYGGRSVRPVR
ncbi:MAG: hypothetical protein J6Z14_02340 [Prevotella sp.]|nr:hypothetical protein [Prevotella sp.]